MQFKTLLFAACITGIMYSCTKDEPNKNNTSNITINHEDGTFIINEGGFLQGNASISYVSEIAGTVIHNVFSTINGRPLGDVCQSMLVYGDKAYIVMNNSRKVEIVDATTFKSLAAIEGFTSPRFIVPVSNAKAYVTDLYANGIYVVDLNTNTITKKINCRGWTEEMIQIENELFVTNKQKDQLYIVNISTDEITDSISINYGANAIVRDKNGKLWLSCSGQPGSGNNASIVRIDPVQKQVEQHFTFSQSTDDPWRLSINKSGDTIYFLNKDCYRMSITSAALPTQAVINAEGRNFYGLGIHPNGHIYLADAVDFVQKGRIYIYDAQGNQLKEFLGGMLPSGFNFR